MRTKNYLAMLAAVLAMAATSACGGGETAAAETALPADSDEESALSLLTDVATTQYFTDEAVAEEDVDTIFGAGINAPSALNGQNWHFSAITDKEVLEQIASEWAPERPRAQARRTAVPSPKPALLTRRWPL